MLAFRNLGLVTPCPRLALVFYLFRNLTNFDCVPPAYPLGIWKGSCGLITLSAIFISFLLIQRLVLSILFSKSILKTHQTFFFISIFFAIKIAVRHFSASLHVSQLLQNLQLLFLKYTSFQAHHLQEVILSPERRTTESCVLCISIVWQILPS
jgi:hypothetical protein